MTPQRTGNVGLLSLENPTLFSMITHPEEHARISTFSHKEVSFTCACGNVFTKQVRVMSKRSDYSCPRCHMTSVVKGVNDLATTHPDVADMLVEPEQAHSVMSNSQKSLLFRCDNGHTRSRVISDVVSGVQCRDCYDHERSHYTTVEGTRTEVLRISESPMGEELVNDSDGEILINSSVKVLWSCSLGHRYESSPKNRTMGRGCPYCAGFKVLEGYNSLADTDPWIVPYLVDDKDAKRLSRGSDVEVSYKCSSHHVNESAVSSIVRTYQRYGRVPCLLCSGKVIEPGVNDVFARFPELRKEWNDPLDPDLVTAGTNQSVLWKCEYGHQWYARISDRTRSDNPRGCPSCSTRESTPEKELYDFIVALIPDEDVKQNDRTLISPLELDVYIPGRNIAIEFNGVYWHSEERGKDRNYHHSKWERCRDQGIQLITVWEDDWRERQEIVKSMLSHKIGVDDAKRVYARTTTVKVLDYATSKNFLDSNHIQGSARGSLYLGLCVARDDIVAVSVWRKNGTTLYLDRYATSTTVIGGMGKLLKEGKRWAKDNSVDKIVSFSDNEVSDGGLYEKLGFVLDKELAPDYSYVYRGNRTHKFNFRLKRFLNDDALLFQEGLSERELAKLNGIPRVWDSGKKRWVLHL